MDWKIEGKSLAKEFEFANFPDAIAFVNKILPLAEVANHQPDSQEPPVRDRWHVMTRRLAVWFGRAWSCRTSAC